MLSPGLPNIGIEHIIGAYWTWIILSYIVIELIWKQKMPRIDPTIKGARLGLINSINLKFAEAREKNKIALVGAIGVVIRGFVPLGIINTELPVNVSIRDHWTETGIRMARILTTGGLVALRDVTMEPTDAELESYGSDPYVYYGDHTLNRVIGAMILTDHD
jgi:hypothetical protein